MAWHGQLPAPILSELRSKGKAFDRLAEERRSVPMEREATTSIQRDQAKLVLALPNSERAFSVVCDASDFAIGSALMQEDDQGHDRVIAYESRQLKAAERNYPVYEKELLSVKYALEKFRVHLWINDPLSSTRIMPRFVL